MIKIKVNSLETQKQIQGLYHTYIGTRRRKNIKITVSVSVTYELKIRNEDVNQTYTHRT